MISRDEVQRELIKALQQMIVEHNLSRIEILEMLSEWLEDENTG